MLFVLVLVVAVVALIIAALLLLRALKVLNRLSGGRVGRSGSLAPAGCRLWFRRITPSSTSMLLIFSLLVFLLLSDGSGVVAPRDTM